MAAIKSLIFWVSGVVTPALTGLTTAALPQQGSRIDADVWFGLLDLARELAAGTISESDYCEEVVARTSSPITGAELSAAIEQAVAPSPDMFPLYDEIKDLCRLYLLVDLPERWFAPLLRDARFAQTFSDPGAILRADRFGVKSSLELPITLAHSGLFDNQATLLIDADPRRAMQSTRAGLYAPIFVDAARLRREFVLWGLLPST